MTILDKRYNNRLEIFEKFKVDRNLPKFSDMTREEESKRNRGIGRNGSTAVYSGENSIYSAVTSTETASTTGSTYLTGISGTSTVYVVDNGGSSHIDSSNSVSFPQASEDQGVLDTDMIFTIQQFFQYVGFRAISLSNLRYKRKVKALEKLLEQCKTTGQVSFEDLTVTELARLKLEYVLCAKGFKTCVEEKYLVEGVKHLSEKDQELIELEWIRDFNRIVPQKIIKRKDKADKLKIFDNYVVLHVRPSWYGDEIERVSKDEADRRKDPILFGVMDCSRRLYYIGDWIDQQCHLTMAELLDKFGEGAIDINKDFSRTNPQLPLIKNPELPKLEKEIPNDT